MLKYGKKGKKLSYKREWRHYRYLDMAKNDLSLQGII